MASNTLLYIANHLSYKPRQDSNISTFIEIMKPQKSNIVSSIYKNPSMDLTDFDSSNYLNNRLEKVSKKQKYVVLLGDFNSNLIIIFTI